MQKQYDLIIPLGEACSCTEALRDACLQRASYPLDWLFGSDFMGRVDLLISDFEHFIEKEDLRSAGYNNEDKNNLCDVYDNHHNGITFNHDFPAGMALEDSFAVVKEKYDRRIRRLISQTETAQKVLMVYLETPNCQHQLTDNEILKKAHQKISDRFFHQEINLLYFSCQPESRILHLDPHITTVTFNYKKRKDGAKPYEIEKKLIQEYLKPYKLKMTFQQRLQILFREEQS